MADKKLNLLAEFPEVTTEAWMQKITADLKGADFAKKLVWKTNEGFNVMPFYRTEDLADLKTVDSAPGVFPYVRGTKTNNNWYVRQNIEVTQPDVANAKALDLLLKGVTSLGFKIHTKDLNADFVVTLLQGINPELVELNFHVCIKQTAQLIDLLSAYYASNSYDASKLKGSVNCDPINRMLVKGKNFTVSDVTQYAVAVIEAGKSIPKYRVLGVNAISLNKAGAYCVQELGYALAWGNQYLQLATEAGVPAAIAAKAIKFNMGVGGNYFMEIAKFRAARMLWAMIVDAYKPASDSASKMNVYAETSVFNKTVFDAHVNLLRTQTEAMSASLAGVDSLAVNPFDITFKNSDDISERIARNQQLLLKEESHFDKVVDPAAGSYYIETLTNQLAEKAWQLFLDVEEKGGFLAQVLTGSVQAEMLATMKKRQKDVSSRREILLGTNQFPNFSETASEKIEMTGCRCGCAVESGVQKLTFQRGAEEFETLRFATECATKRPKAFMLTIGNLAMRLARAQFSCNFFACAGYEVVDNLGFETVEAGIEAARKADADIIVLCSSDDEYAELAPAAFNAIGGKELFVVAGAPACTDDLKAIGIEYFVNVRSNVLETLQAFNAKLLK